MTSKDPRQRMLDEMLCPGAVRPIAQAKMDVDDVGLLRCGICHKPILVRNGYTSMHGREPYLRDISESCRT